MGEGLIAVLVSQQWTEALNAPVSVYVYERNNVKLTDLRYRRINIETLQSKSIEAQEAKLNRTLHCSSCAHDMTVPQITIMGASRA